MLCKQETHGDPRACLKVGAAVSDCAAEYFTAALNRCGNGTVLNFPLLFFYSFRITPYFKP